MNGPFGVSTVEPGIASLRFATDENPYLGPDAIVGLKAAVEELAKRQDISVVVLEGGKRHFSAGASIDSLTGPDFSRGISTYAPEVARLVLAIPQPTVAALTGHAIGGGFVVGLLCDMLVLASESLYGANFMSLGFTPGMGATWVVEEAMGSALARDLLFTGRLIRGDEIARAACPLSHRVAARADVLPRALSIARDVASAPREALLLLKRQLAGPRSRRLEEAVAGESAMHRTLFAAPETRVRILERHAAGSARSRQ